VNRRLFLRSVALRLTRFKAKSLLLGLGIAVGVLATVLLGSVAGRVRARFLAFIGDAYPSDSIVLFAGGGPMSGSGGKRNLKLSDVETVVASLGVKTWDPLVFAGPRDLRHGGDAEQVGVLGLSEQAEQVRHRSVREGRFFTAEEVRGRARVALIGTTTAARLFPGESPLGARLEVDNVPFEIAGVLAPIGVDPHGGDQDNVLVVPYTTLMDTMLRTTSLSGATLILDDRDRIEPASREVVEIVRRLHQIGEGDKDDFSVFTSASMQQMFRRNFRTFELFVPLISGTLFLIAALVVLAILQVAVRERRREIGLRRALGARSRDVGRQLLAEVGMIAFAAAFAGVGLARLALVWVAPLLERKMGVSALALSPAAIAIGVLAALATGIVGAWLPARRAARLDPVIALR
jgi:putative ABC transport system permease protein